jgi:hypothetical protein
LFDVVWLVRKSSNPGRPEISGNSGVAMANMGRRNRRQRKLGEQPLTLRHPARPPAIRSTVSAAFPPAA